MQKKSLPFLTLPALSLLFIGGMFLLPQRADAQFITVSEVNPELLASEFSTAVSTVESIAQDLYEWSELLLREKLKQQLIQLLVDEMLAEISGNGGGFIANWETYVNGLAGEVISQFGEEFFGIDLCAPIKVQLNVIFSGPSATGGGSIANRFKCTLDDITGNFENGGWIGYQKSFASNNNFWGVYLQASNELFNRVASNQEISIAEAVAGGGFLGTKECDSNGENCNIITPARTVGDAVAEALGADIKRIASADDLSSITASIANAVGVRILREGINAVSGTSSANRSSRQNQVTQATDSNSRSSENRFNQERSSTLRSVAEAILVRESAQQILERSMLYFSNGEVDHAQSALEYIYVEFAKVSPGIGDFILSTSRANVANPEPDTRNPNCTAAARNYPWIRNTTLPRIERKLTFLGDAREIIDISLDDDETNNPDTDNSHNRDIIELLKTAKEKLTDLVIGDTVDGEEITLEIAQRELSEVRSLIGSDAALSAQSFRAGLNELTTDLQDTYDFVETYNTALRVCLKSSVVTPLSDSTTPTNNWPW